MKNILLIAIALITLTGFSMELLAASHVVSTGSEVLLSKKDDDKDDDDDDGDDEDYRAA